MGLGLRALGRLAGSTLSTASACASRPSAPSTSASRNGFRAAAAAGRTFKRGAASSASPARQPHGAPARACSTSRPTTSSRCCRRRSATSPPSSCARPRQDADAACAAPDGAARAGRRARRSRCSACPRSSAAPIERALGGDRRAGRRGARPRRHGPRRRGPRARRGVAHRARAVGRRRPAGAPTCRPFAGEDVPAAALAILEPRPLFDPFELRDHGAPQAATSFVLNGVKSLVPRAAQRRAVRSSPPQLEGDGPGAVHRRVRHRRACCVEPEPAMGVRAAATGTADPRGRRACPATALLGDGDPAVYARVRHARAARLVRAGGRHRPGGARLRDPVRQRAQGVRRADLPTARRSRSRSPTSRIELEGMRLATCRAARRADARQAASPARPRSRARCAPSKGMADRLRRRAAARRPRLRQGAPGRALVPRPARGRRHGGSAARLMHQPRDPQEVRSRSSSRRTRSRPRSSARSRASTTSPSTSTRRSSTCSRR